MLIVEDEPYLAEAVRDGLRLEAIAADVAGDDSNVALVSDMSFQNLGDETNGIDDGDWTLYATMRRGPTGCPASVKATALGVISVDVGGSDLDLVVPKASLKGSLVHSLVVP